MMTKPMMDPCFTRINELRYLRFHPECGNSGYFPTPKTQRFMSVKSSVTTFGSSSKELTNYEKVQVLNQIAAKFSKS